ncbi:MAG: SPOR domain-containing protein, partial [Pseudomonadota bacterium]
GVALDMTGDHKAAQQTYRVGLKRNPGQPGLKNNLGLSLAMAGNYPKAISLLKELANGPKATDRHRQNLALVYGLAGDASKAENVARNDLNVREVKANLAYYRWLRAAKAGNKSPETAKTGRVIGTGKPKKADKLQPQGKRQMAAKTAKNPLGRPKKDDLGPDIYSLGVDMGRGTTKKKPGRKPGAGALPGSVIATLKSMKRSGNFWVQLGSYKTRTLGTGAWRRVKSKQKKLLTAASHEIVKADLGSKGIYYRLQVGPYKDRAGANSTCKRLKVAAGGCFVARRGKPSRASRSTGSSVKKALMRKKAAAGKSSRMARRPASKRTTAKKVMIDKTGRKAVIIDRTRSKARTAKKVTSKGPITMRDKSGKVKAVIIDKTATKTN